MDDAEFNKRCRDFGIPLSVDRLKKIKVSHFYDTNGKASSVKADDMSVNESFVMTGEIIHDPDDESVCSRCGWSGCKSDRPQTERLHSDRPTKRVRIDMDTEMWRDPAPERQSRKMRLQNAFVEKASDVKAKRERQHREYMDRAAMKVLAVARTEVEELKVDELDLIERVIALI